MSLAARRWARLREEFVMRLGCLLVSVAVLASLVLEPPRAKAFAVTSSAVTALAGGFLNACGLVPVVSGMSSSSEVNESVARLIQDFLNEEVGGITIADWALSFGEIGLAVKDKKIIIPKPLAEKLGEFAQWVAGKYGTQAGENVVYSNESITFPDGTSLMLTSGLALLPGYSSTFTFEKLGSSIPYGTRENPYIIRISSELELRFFKNSSSFCAYGSREMVWNFGNTPKFKDGILTIFICPDLTGTSNAAFEGCLVAGLVYYDSDYRKYILSSNVSIFLLDSETLAGFISNADLSLDVSDTMQEVLDRLTALEEGQSIALDVGATQSMEIQDILQGILDAILAGELSASAEIVDEAAEPVEPDPPVVPAVPSGLDELGEALTSRFPFSIPWDVYKGVSLLAAPPKAPYFEVDFLAPIGHRVGGWQGSTTIVLDFSEYEVIGQVCRWTSTIGFCLMLAAGTKRLIWTA